MNAYPESLRLLISLWVVQTTAAFTLALANAFVLDGVPNALFWAIAFGFTLAFGAARGPSPGRSKAANALAIIGLAAIVLALPSGRMAYGVMACLLWIQAGRNLVLGERRDVHFSLLLCAILVLFAASESRSGWFIVVLAAHTLAALIALSLCWAIRCRTSASADARPTVHASDAAGLLVFSLVVFCSAAAWYLFVPRPAAPHIGMIPYNGGQDYSERAWKRDDARHAAGKRANTSTGASAEAGASTSYNGLGESALELRSGASSNALSNQIVMYVQTDRPLYLRGQTFDTFEQDRWTRSNASEQRISDEGGKFRFAPPRGEDGTAQTVEHIVTVAADLPARLYTVNKTVELQFPGEKLAVDRDGNMRLPAPLRANVRYIAKSSYRLVQGRTAVSQPLRDPSPYLQVPANTSDRLRALAVDAAGPATDALTRATAIESHLRTHYTYDAHSAIVSQGVTPVDTFLFGTRRGHCEYFASSMALMLRLQDIPARIATGFSAQTYNPITGYYEVRAMDGHAWVEAHIEPYGWVLFEPTPGFALPTSAPQAATSAEQIDRYLDALVHQEALLKQHGLLTILQAYWSTVKAYAVAVLARLQDLLDTIGALVIRNLIPLCAGLAAIALLGAVGYRYRGPLARLTGFLVVAAVARVRPHAAPAAAFRWTCRLTALHGLPRSQAETADEFSDACARHWPEAQACVETIVAAFNDACYGRERPTPETVQAILAAFRRAFV